MKKKLVFALKQYKLQFSRRKFYNRIEINFCNDGLKSDNKICYFG